jgi:putative ABC transport system permease protein
MTTFLQDFRFALRTLSKSPGFTAAAVLTLGLGIGGAATIFAGVDALFVRALPLPDPDRLMTLWASSKGGGFDHANVSYRDFEDWKREASSFEGLAALLTTSPTLTERGEPEAIDAALVTGDFFHLLGVRPALGRLLTSFDDRPQAGRTAVLSWNSWQRRFGADPSVLGATLTLDGQPTTIVGVLPRRPIPALETVEVWSALGPDLGKPERGDRSYLAVGRLRKGVSVSQCRAELDAISRRLAAAYPKTNAGFEVNVIPVEEDLFGKKFRTSLYTLLAAVGLVLAIACANIAQLLLARGASREREIAVRAALGASRARVVRQMLTEHLLLALLGGFLGLLLALWGVQTLVGLLPPYTARLPEIALDARVFLFGLLLTVGTAAAFGLLPALTASRAGFGEALRAASLRGTAGGRRARLQAVLVACEVALALVLLSGAGLIAKSLTLLRGVAPGFRPDHVVTMRIDLPERAFPGDGPLRAFYGPLLERLGALPGVRAAAAVSTLPMSGNNSWTFVTPEGRAPAPPGQEPRVGRLVVSPDYFRAMGIPILQGRAFASSDNESVGRVAVVNQEMARRDWPGQDAIGKRFVRGRPGPDSPWIEVVGIAGDVRHRGRSAPVRPEMFFPLAQAPEASVTLVLQAPSDPPGLAAAARREILAMRPEQAVSSVQTLDRVVAEDTSSDALLAWLTAAFAVAAVLLATMGLYAVVSLAVGQSTREIGIRMALGAQARDVMGLILGRWMRLTLAGMAVGLAATLVLGRLVTSVLYSVRPTDASVLSAISLLLAAVALVAGYLPARRATRVDPARALRAE